MKKTLILPLLAAAVLSSCAGNPEGKKSDAKDSVQTEALEQVTGDSYTVNADSSTVQWTGTKMTGSHTGTVKVKSGVLKINDGKLAGGDFVLDLSTISSTDLEGEMKQKLDGHLKAADFFDVEKFPEAKFEITAVDKGATDQDLKISGNLTIKGTSKNITFDAKVVEANANVYKATADFNIVRADWGVSYEGKKDDLISKEINFKIALVANK